MFSEQIKYGYLHGNNRETRSTGLRHEHRVHKQPAEQ